MIHHKPIAILVNQDDQNAVLRKGTELLFIIYYTQRESMNSRVYSRVATIKYPVLVCLYLDMVKSNYVTSTIQYNAILYYS